jgi:hypothetical protein
MEESLSKWAFEIVDERERLLENKAKGSAN